MANFQPSSIVSEIRGSVGSLTYSRNRSGAIVKQKLVQPASNTALQQAVREAMADGVAAWQAATQAEQNSWAQYASQNVVGKNISRKIKRAGYNEFMSRWLNRLALESSGTGFYPEPKVRIFPVITSVVQATSSIEMFYDCLVNPSTVQIAVYATPPISPGINHINQSFYRLIGHFTPGAQTGSQELFTWYDAYYSPDSGDTGKKIGIMIRAINTDNFAASQFFFAQILISGGLVLNAPSIDQSRVQTVTLTGGVTTFTASFTSTPAEGQLILLFFSTKQNRTATAPSGFSTLYNVNGNPGTGCFYKIASSSESNSYTITFNSSSVNLTTVLVSVNDVNQTTPVSIANSPTNGTGSTLDGASANQAIAAKTLVLSAFNTGGTGISSVNNSFAFLSVTTATFIIRIAQRTYDSSDTGQNCTATFGASTFARGSFFKVNPV